MITINVNTMGHNSRKIKQDSRAVTSPKLRTSVFLDTRQIKQDSRAVTSPKLRTSVFLDTR